MLDKWRNSATNLLKHALVFLVALALMGCFTFWRHIDEFGPFVPEATGRAVPNYVLIEPGDQLVPVESYPMKELSADDKRTLIDLKNFNFTMNHDPCRGKEPLLLIVVHSNPSHAQRRNILRETWGRKHSEIILLFLVGLSSEYKDQLEAENHNYGDLIQGNFIDAYRNMTYKHAMALKWTVYHCQSAKYILKLDDDVFINIPAMIEFLKHELSPLGARRLILCRCLYTSKVKRSWRSKWRVSPLEYPDRNYPNYCEGWAVFYSPDTVFLLYKEAQRENYFWIDDVHITGTLAAKVNLSHTSMHPFVLTSAHFWDLVSNRNCKQDFLFAPPNLDDNYIRNLYTIVTQTNFTC